MVNFLFNFISFVFEVFSKQTQQTFDILFRLSCKIYFIHLNNNNNNNKDSFKLIFATLNLSIFVLIFLACPNFPCSLQISLSLSLSLVNN